MTAAVIMNKMKTLLTGWGNYPSSTASVYRPERYQELNIFENPTLARGLGRSYGDAALNSQGDVILMERLNRFLSFDEKTGLLRAEAGISLKEVLEVFTNRGWFVPIVPGTKYVTLGGCFAADIHGKNHHIDGSFSNYVQEIELILGDGSRKCCSRKQHADLFWASAGGMGLTGIISEMTLQLVPIETAYVKVTHRHAPNLDAIFELLEDKKYEEQYSVAWIDCLATGKDFGRSILMTGHHAKKSEVEHQKKDPLKIPLKRQLSIPFNCPSWVLNTWSVRAFNSAYYALQKRKTEPFIIDYDSYFFPLDVIHNWNKLYGKTGFVQYQLVVPSKTARLAIHDILTLSSTNRCASFLAVLKKFGPEGQGLLSFPHEGYTLALDIPLKDPSLFDLLNRLDEVVLKYEGRLYLAKDARMKSDTFRAMYPRYPLWQAIKAQVDPDGKFVSDLSKRLQIEGLK